MESVGLIGAGLLGAAISARLLDAGRNVLGYDISDDRCGALLSSGAQVAGSAILVAEKCPIVLLSLPNSDIATSVLEKLESALYADQLVIDTTTGAPEAAERWGPRLQQRGVLFVDATIAGSSAQARDGETVALVGGELAGFERAKEILDTFCRQTFHVGGWGSGARMKLVVNLALGLHRAVLAESLALAQALKLDQRMALDILRATPARSTVMDTKGEKMLRREFRAEARLSQHLKDVELILQAAQRTDTGLPLSEVHRELLQQVVDAGGGDLDNSAVLMAYLADETL